MKELSKLFKNNEEWILKKTFSDPEYFSKSAEKQVPSYLWIGCSDSRVPASEIVGLEPGELFVHRNIANLFLHADLNSLSVLEYAVGVLGVQHVIVCGHYGCGGIKAAMENTHVGLVDNWLRNIRDIYVKNKAELEKIPNEKRRFERLVELNVITQAKNICHTTIVQNAWAKKRKLCIHGWVYDLETGKLKDLDCTINTADKIDSIYQIRD